MWQPICAGLDLSRLSMRADRPIGCWLLAIGYWLLAIGYRLSVMRVAPCYSLPAALIEAAANKTVRIFLTYHEIVALRAEGPGKAGASR
jgi:hypothetical protein